MECLYSYRGALSGTQTLFLMWDSKMEVKYWVKSWTALLAEINFQDQQRKSFWQYYLRERERRGETERDGELKDILVHATVQGKISAPRGCQ